MQVTMLLDKDYCDLRRVQLGPRQLASPSPSPSKPPCGLFGWLAIIALPFYENENSHTDVDTRLRLSPQHCALTTTHTWPHGRFALLCCPGWGLGSLNTHNPQQISQTQNGALKNKRDHHPGSWLGMIVAYYTHGSLTSFPLYFLFLWLPAVFF